MGVPGRILIWFALALAVEARPLLVLHTNDLHGFLEHTVSDPGLGGYSRIGRLIRSEKERHRRMGVDTLVLDAGDFMEGSIFYLAGDGLRVWEAFGMLGHDAVVIGNHDYYMGPRLLNRMLGKSPPPFAFLGTNLGFNRKRESILGAVLYPDLVRSIRHHAFFRRAGFKIGVIGVTTDEVFYKWAIKKVKITDPVRAGIRAERELKSAGADFVIALTHLSMGDTLELVRKGRHIDLVVSGHEHGVLRRPALVRNRQGRPVPVVQAGGHGSHLGALTLDLERGRPPRVVDYRTIPVRGDLPGDPEISAHVAETRRILEDEYGRGHLAERLGLAEAPLYEREDVLTPWTAFVTDALREAGGDDLSFHSPKFGGTVIPAGPVTREDVFQSQPRVFDFSGREGWTIYRVRILGLVVHALIRMILKWKWPVSMSGIEFDLAPRKPGERIDYPSGRFRVGNIRIGGAEIEPFRNYRIALSEGIIAGGLGISPLVRLVFRGLMETETSVWEAVSRKVRREGGVPRDYGRGLARPPGRFFRPSLAAQGAR